MGQITTLTFFKYRSLTQKLWGFKMMQFAHAPLQQVQGQVFYKLMGSGKGAGFNPWPDWSVYALLQVWEEERYADDFFRTSLLMEQYRANSTEQWTLYLKSLQSKGEWSGGNPFEVSSDLDQHNEYLAVITRATIKPARLYSFWKYVPTSQKPLGNNPGLIFTKGIGEAPIIQMATFSLWKNPEALRQFAYESAEHREAIHRTRKLDWYREELFSRFQPYRSVGTWKETKPMPDLP